VGLYAALRPGLAEETTTRRRELPEVRREQILDAAATVFLDRGLTQATMADVAEAAGVAKGTIYLYFDSKSAVLTALRARYTGQWLAQSGRLDTPPGRGGHIRQLRLFLGEMYDFHAANQRLHHLLVDAAEMIELRGRKVQVVGVDPRSYRVGLARPERFADPDAELRILLCHFPQVIDRLEPGFFDLILAGHLHAGQICLPYPGGKLRLSHIRWTYVEGLYERPGGTLHLSAGLGTTFVPFRFFARPAAYEVVLRSSTRNEG